MKRNQCIICFERILQKKNKLSASHEDIIHDGWYHNECIIQHIEYCKKNNKKVLCPLCRRLFIIKIPNYEYSPNINIITNNTWETLDDTDVNIQDVNIPLEIFMYIAPPMRNRQLWLITTTIQTCLMTRCFICYQHEFYITLYFYVLFTGVLMINSLLITTSNVERVRIINRWKLFTKVLLFILWYEFLYSIVKKTINDCINYYNGDNGDIYEYTNYDMYEYMDNDKIENDKIEYVMIEDDIINKE
uniref:Uncharacterized protein n=1 Tax=viral metagenome TaxID=1070528 RepID=A0A6C0BRP2_9ZZZZ